MTTQRELRETSFASLFLSFSFRLQTTHSRSEPVEKPADFPIDKRRDFYQPQAVRVCPIVTVARFVTKVFNRAPKQKGTARSSALFLWDRPVCLLLSRENIKIGSIPLNGHDALADHQQEDVLREEDSASR
jgi:hypothetical protein